MSHPYKALPAQAFWRSAVAERDIFDLRDLWTPKFALSPDSAIATAGSCFAQHIGRQLVRRGFNWLNAEPAPGSLTPQQRHRFGYDLFTFRTGNIYTTPLLEQWMKWGLDAVRPPDEVWQQDGRYFDPFRPAIEPDGFGSRDELIHSRANVTDRMAEVVAATDCFIFTLGLTECWIDAEGGHTYPVCPGTVRGTFDPARHLFRNLGYDQVYDSLANAIAMMRTVNPAIRFILTVSPVPLTATASGQHVLVANSRSKSILRAVAGAAADAIEDVDYFPSFELVTSFTTRGVLYEPNLRSVTAFGVERVMDHFFAGLAHGPISRSEPAASPGRAERMVRDEEDVACEDLLLDP